MIKISSKLNRVLFDAIHDLVGMACDRGVPLPYFGICRNVYHILDRTEEAHYLAYTVLADIFEDMGLHRSHPVSTTDLFCEFWEGYRFKLRMDLCSKLMTYLDIQLAQENLREQDTLLDALKALKNLPNSMIPRPHYGICSNASELVSENFPTYWTLAQIFEGMGYADRDYPLGQDDGYVNKWENPRRRELLAQVIQHLIVQESIQNDPT